MRNTIVGITILVLAACASRPPVRVLDNPSRIDLAGCENSHQLTSNLYAGGDPQGEKAFLALKGLGVKTIISVDGAKPAVDEAARHGIRYVHLPIGYDRITKERALELARAVQDLDGPVYLHCHHGFHRSSAAASAAMVVLGQCSNDQAIANMKALGCSPKYEGLYADILALRVGSSEVASITPAFVSTATLPGFIATMAVVDRKFEDLQVSRKAGWKKSAEHPDIDPPHEALQFLELWAEMNRMPAVTARPEKFRTWMTDSESAARDLEAALRKGDGEAAGKAFTKVETGCKSCHEVYRNKPQAK